MTAVVDDVEHLVITKFNILTNADYGDAAKRLDDSWLRARLDLFERVCVPSVEAQTRRDFTWIVLCDARSPVWFERVMSSSGSFRAEFVHTITNATMADILRQRGYLRSTHVVSSRLDNDDAVSRDYVARVREAFQGTDSAYVCFPVGLRLLHGDLYHAYWRSNPFMSRFEAADDAKLVYEHQHHVVRERAAIKNVYTRSTWLRSIHDLNTVETAVGIPASPRAGRTFGLLPGTVRDRPTSLGERVTRSGAGYRARLLRSKKVRAVLGSVRGGG